MAPFALIPSNHLSTTDGTTQIVYTPLREKKPAKAGKGAAKAKAASPVIDPDGKRAEKIGRIDGINAAMWFLAIDAEAGAAWTGGGDDGDGEDFDRAMEVDEGKIKVGKAMGVIANLEDVGWSHVWRDGKDVLLLHHYRAGDAKSPEAVRAIGARVAQLPADGKPRKLGEVKVTCGVLALLLPYEHGTFSPKDLAAAKKTTDAVNSGDGRVLIAVPNGTYQLLSERLGPKDYEDEYGRYIARLRITASR